ncbi:MAG: hypothetical protein PWR27_784 [Petroclostridium sp.]|jgi:hypothetical protein|nr:hypothetical protein [Clostridia bacterium]MDK2810075.1 hypothetical protein [Petroclostridium sp.]
MSNATEEPSPCRSPEQSSIFSSLFVPGAPGVVVSVKVEYMMVPSCGSCPHVEPCLETLRVEQCAFVRMNTNIVRRKNMQYMMVLIRTKNIIIGG